jgi:ABC-type phosphate transport system ATPase subunit
MLEGSIVELAPTEQVFSATPADQRTSDYVNGTFG